MTQPEPVADARERVAYEAFWQEWRATHPDYMTPAAFPCFHAGYAAGAADREQAVGEQFGAWLEKAREHYEEAKAEGATTERARIVAAWDAVQWGWDDGASESHWCDHADWHRLRDAILGATHDETPT